MSSLSKWWFKTITSNFLIYNTCWEDPQVDRLLLNLDSDSDILMITSAGDNALSYLLDNPASIDCVDMNFRQNALLELKIALFEHSSSAHLWALFGNGNTTDYQVIYSKLRGELSKQGKQFWDAHIHTFDPAGKGFYSSGLSGYFARYINRVIDKKKLRASVNTLINEPNYSVREHIYSNIEHKLWNGMSKYIWKWDGLLSLAGIPKEQKDAIGDLNTFMNKVFRSVFVEHQAHDNYFWRLYLNGSYNENFRPEYLIETNFEHIKSNTHRINFYSSTIQERLSLNSKKYSHFVLLDHMDWLATNNVEELTLEWQSIFEHAKPGAKVLFRSAYSNPDFLPSFVLNKLRFENIDPTILEKDRVGTYSSTHLATIHV